LIDLDDDTTTTMPMNPYASTNNFFMQPSTSFQSNPYFPQKISSAQFAYPAINNNAVFMSRPLQTPLSASSSLYTPSNQYMTNSNPFGVGAGMGVLGATMLGGGGGATPIQMQMPQPQQTWNYGAQQMMQPQPQAQQQHQQYQQGGQDSFDLLGLGTGTGTSTR